MIYNYEGLYDNKSGLIFKFYVGMCLDGTVVKTGKHSGVITQIKELVHFLN